MDLSHLNKDQRGAALAEVAIVLTVLLTVILGVVEIGRLMWTVNALTDATRQGARYAVVNPVDQGKVKNMVVYGSPAGGTTPVVSGLAPANVNVSYIAGAIDCGGVFGLGCGQVQVNITNYSFNFAVPLVGGSVALPAFKTTLNAESAGVTPP